MISKSQVPIRLGLKQMSNRAYRDLIFHEVPRNTIERDITLFLEFKLVEIREQRSLNPSWPEEEYVQALVNMAVPLFIFAATVCRFLAEQSGNARRRLSAWPKVQARHA